MKLTIEQPKKIINLTPAHIEVEGYEVIQLDTFIIKLTEFEKAIHSGRGRGRRDDVDVREEVELNNEFFNDLFEFGKSNVYLHDVIVELDNDGHISFDSVKLLSGYYNMGYSAIDAHCERRTRRESSEPAGVRGRVYVNINDQLETYAESDLNDSLERIQSMIDILSTQSHPRRLRRSRFE